MTKQVAKQSIAHAIRNAVIADHTDKLKMDLILKTMDEKKINRNMIKATIRSGNQAFLVKDDPDGTKTAALVEKVCTWIDSNLPKVTRK